EEKETSDDDKIDCYLRFQTPQANSEDSFKCKHLFSDAGKQKTDDRNRLKPNT
ncbi:17197_t:CDS:2, partial [Gigaspora margarita]